MMGKKILQFYSQIFRLIIYLDIWIHFHTVVLVIFHNNQNHGQIQRGDRGFRPPPPGKLQVAIGFLTKTGTEPPREAIGPIARGPIASQGRSVRPSMKYVDD